jgi:uncharacterized protein
MTNLLWTLITIQIAMAAFDTIYHHEMTERLAWRASQRHELALHAARSLIYALLFATLGFFETHGLLALLVIALLSIEVVVTLTDFVEEDMTRKLPATERVTHTLLALNYGAILVLLVPVLIGWAAKPTALVPASYGAISACAVLAAAGAVMFGLRELFASRRAATLGRGCVDTLVDALAEPQSVLITGATGLIGTRLVEALTAAGHDVTVLTRSPAKAAALSSPLRIVTSLEQVPLDARIDAVVNLAGEPIANWLWTPAKKRRIRESRLNVTAGVIRLIAALKRPPKVLINASAVGWYGPQGDTPLTEAAIGKPSFGNEVCGAWEAAARQAERHGVRVVLLRIGIVLGIEGGMLGQLLTPFEYGLGARLGGGAQWMSWIARDDVVRLIAHAIACTELSGPVNATAPEPVSNADFTRALGRALRRPAILTIPALLLHRLGGAMADELMLASKRVLPEKALASGFVFRHPTLSGALAAVLAGSDRGTVDPASDYPRTPYRLGQA